MMFFLIIVWIIVFSIYFFRKEIKKWFIDYFDIRWSSDNNEKEKSNIIKINEVVVKKNDRDELDILKQQQGIFVPTQEEIMSFDIGQEDEDIFLDVELGDKEYNEYEAIDPECPDEVSVEQLQDGYTEISKADGEINIEKAIPLVNLLEQTLESDSSTSALKMLLKEKYSNRMEKITKQISKIVHSVQHNNNE